MSSAEVTSTIHSQASIDVRAIALPRAKWEIAVSPDGRLACQPEKGTWCAHIVRGRSAHEVIVVPMIACPSCNGLLMLTPSRGAAKVATRLLHMPVPIAHHIDHLGKVSPDIRCQHGRCSFHRKVYLDRWNKTKALFAIAYTRGAHGEIEIAYSHAIDSREARMHLGTGDFRIIASGPAVGFFVDEKTGRMTAD